MQPRRRKKDAYNIGNGRNLLRHRNVLYVPAPVGTLCIQDWIKFREKFQGQSDSTYSFFDVVNWNTGELPRGCEIVALYTFRISVAFLT